MFDRVDAGAERVLDPLGAVRMRGDSKTCLVRLLHSGGEFGRGHRGRSRCTLLGYDSTGCDHLECPGAALDLRARAAAEGVGAVDLPTHEEPMSAGDCQD